MMFRLFTSAVLVGLAFLIASCSDSGDSDEAPGPSGAGRPSGPTTGPAAPPQVGTKARDFTLTTLDGQPLHLSSRVAAGPVVLIVLRGWPGYQCPICTKQVGQFTARADDFQAAGAHVVLVYPGPADHLMDRAQEFVSGVDIPANFTFVIDPDLTFTSTYGLRWDAPKETAYPSTFVIDRDGVVRFAKVSRTHGDRGTAEEVLKALAQVGANGS